MMIKIIEKFFQVFNITCPHACLCPHLCAIRFGHVLDPGRVTPTHRSAWLVVTPPPPPPTVETPPPMPRSFGHSSQESLDTSGDGRRHPSTLVSGNGIRPYEYRHVQMETHRSAVSAGWEGGGHGTALGTGKSAYLKGGGYLKGTLNPQTRGWIGGGGGVGLYDTADLRGSQKKRVREVCLAGLGCSL